MYPRKGSITLAALILSLSAGILAQYAQVPLQDIDDIAAPKQELSCILPEPHAPSGEDGLHPSSDFWDSEIMTRQIHRLSEAVKIPSVSYDDMGDVHNDTRWLVFEDLHDVLQSLFPRVHKHAILQKVNRFGLIYTIHGSLNALRPIVFTAHQDVVPVQVEATWKYPPFEPFYDGQFLWGRGVADCKNNLIGILSAVEYLFGQEKWKPRRTIILAFGFDEEIGGWNGASHIAAELENIWGQNGIEFILDEGGMGLVTLGNAIYALPAVHEKSYLDVYLHLEIEGGHSSKPPPHSGIGIMSEIAVALEAHPYRPVLLADSPYYKQLVCQVIYSPEADPWLRDALEDSRLEDIAQNMSSQSAENRFRIQTSQAVDIVQGGSKINALPETVTLGVNYRIALQDSIEIVERNIAEYIKPVVVKHNLTVVSFDGTVADNSGDIREDMNTNNNIKAVLHLREGESTPRTPISSTTNDIWNRFSATVQYVFSRYASKVVPVGDIMNGNTDTRHYWNLSDNIYRWSPARLGTRMNVHTVDERLDMTAHIDGLRLYYG
ncbi:hypothetical protein DPV78_009156 [Talaromyces pinophilus]|nr:hypothetical protein DPV78_009156 [Talaromyces pinophilus]